MTLQQFVLVTLALATWVGGGSILTRSHYRRLGYSWRPFDFPLARFDKREKAILLALLIVSFVLAYFALAPSGNR
jgi:hypothetical protein